MSGTKANRDFKGPFGSFEFKVGDEVKWRSSRPYSSKAVVIDPNWAPDKIAVQHTPEQIVETVFKKKIHIRKDKVVEIKRNGEIIDSAEFLQDGT